MKSAVVCHLFLGLQHAFVRNTSVATMTKFINKTLRGFKNGRILGSWLNSALGIDLQQRTEFLVGGWLEVCVVEGGTEGVVVGCEDARIGVWERHKRDG